ncbi:MAG: FAD-dependent oxidoreductase [Planctomycetaceae bacterium]
MIPTEAQVVIVGGGIAGASIAYHLAKLGWRDIVVLEQGELISGTTSHAPGLVGQLRSSVSLTKLLMDSVALYRTLSVNGEPGYFPVGSLRVASSQERFTELQRQAEFAQRVGLEAHLLSPAEAAVQCPLMSLDGVEGALFVPSDGSATATLLARSLIDAAQRSGVSFHPHVRVRAIEAPDRRIRAVETNEGRIATETLVVAAGIWSPLVARLVGVSLPLTPMQHQYVVTAPLPELAGRTIANLRDPDKLVYLRQRDEALIIGGYERNPRLFSVETIPDRSDPTVQTFDASHFEQLRSAVAQRVPCLATAELAKGVNGLESFTPDGEFLLGPSREVHGFWAACGFCAHGISGAGGVGKALAEWIVVGQPSVDLSATALERFGPQAADPTFINQGASRVYGTYYDLRRVEP